MTLTDVEGQNCIISTSTIISNNELAASFVDSEWGLAWVKGESSEVIILLSLCKGVELDLTSLFPLPRVLSKLSPGPLPSRTSPLLPLQPQPFPPVTYQHSNQVSFISISNV